MLKPRYKSKESNKPDRTINLLQHNIKLDNDKKIIVSKIIRELPVKLLRILLPGIIIIKQENDLRSESEPFPNMLHFSEQCYEIRDELESDVYIAHDIMPLTAATVLSDYHNSRLICDVIEVPSFTGRLLPVKWSQSSLAAFHSAVSNQLSKCCCLTTVSGELAKQLEVYGTSVQVIENYKYSQDIDHSKQLREYCKLQDGDRLLVVMSTIVAGFEDLLTSLCVLPENIHLACFVRIQPKEYEKRIYNLVEV
jgi:hypothetical protein